MIDAYLDRFAGELERRGVVGRDRRRVLAETEDHLRELAAEHDQEAAVSRFGHGEPLAVEIAAQLATSKTIRSTYASFVALALTGLGYLGFLAFVERRGWPDLFSGDHELIGVVAAVGLLFFPQLAFVAGGLALLRALRRHGSQALSAEEHGVMRRRSAVALAAGGATLASMVVWAFEFRDLGPILGACLALAIPLTAGGRMLARSREPHAVVGGEAGDVFEDLRLGRFRAHPWRFALVAAGAAASVGLAVGGPVHAAFEAAALLGCFAIFGRRLALRS